MDLTEARSKAEAKGLSTYFGYVEGTQEVFYELGFLEPEASCTQGLLCALPDGVFRWVTIGRGNSWEQAFKDVEAHVN